MLNSHRDLVRIHESGDFWNEHYMKAPDKLVAKEHPQVKFCMLTQSHCKCGITYKMTSIATSISLHPMEVMKIS